MKILCAAAVAIISNYSHGLAEGVKFPDYKEVLSINFFINFSWMLDIYPDGSAKLIYGSGPTDFAKAPKNTFSFAELYQLVYTNAEKKSKDGNSFAVTILAKSQEPPPEAMYINDKKIMKKIMITAGNKSTPYEKGRFKQLLSTYPPVPEGTK